MVRFDEKYVLSPKQQCVCLFFFHSSLHLSVYEQRDAAEYLEKILCLTSPDASKVAA